MMVNRDLGSPSQCGGPDRLLTGLIRHLLGIEKAACLKPLMGL
jgi:hypothetical protein